MEHDRPPIVGVQRFNLTDSEVVDLKNLSNQGSAAAAYRLAMFYEFVKLDFASSEIYYRRGAQLGDVRAMAFLGAKFFQSNDASVRSEGIYWLREASSRGDKNSADLLSGIKY